MAAEFVTRTTYKTNRSNPQRYILSHIMRHPFVGFMLLFGATGNAILAAVVPNFIGDAVDALTSPTGGGLSAVGHVALAIIATQLLRGIIQLSRNFSAEIFGQRIERDVRDELYSSLLGKSMTFHDFYPVGELMARVTNDVHELYFMMMPGFNLVIGSGMFLLMPVFASPIIYPSLILTPLVFVTAHAIVQYRFVRSMHPVAQEVRRTFGVINAHLAESLDGLQVVKGSAQETNEKKRFDSLADDVRDEFIEQGKIEARYLSYLLLGLAIAFGFSHAVLLYRAGEIGVGQIVNYTMLLVLFGFPVFTSLNALSRIALGYASAGRILNIINTVTDLDQNVNGHRAPIQGKIRFEHVNFQYSEDTKEVLHDVSFEVYAGHTVAIVGQTGSGKSTVTKLVNRIYDATSGQVFIDDVDVRYWDLQSLRSQISIIEQDIFLFSRTIADNIAFGNTTATREEIEEAARKAQAHDFILSFPEGYDTVIGQRGVTLSGGQRQRLAIARAFLTDPPVLILDDSTSAIDSATEDEIQKAIWSASKGRTTLLITHRLSQIRWADHIIVLRKGKVVAQGTHDYLLNTSESYRRIFARYESAPSEQTVR